MFLQHIKVLLVHNVWIFWLGEKRRAWYAWVATGLQFYLQYQLYFHFISTYLLMLFWCVLFYWCRERERNALKFNLDFWVIIYNIYYCFNVIRNPEPFKGKAYLQGQISRTYLQFCAGERLCGSLKKRNIPLDLMTWFYSSKIGW